MTTGVPAQLGGSDSGARQNAAQYITEGITTSPGVGAGFFEVDGVWLFGGTNTFNAVSQITPPQGFSSATGYFHAFAYVNAGALGTINFLNSAGQAQFSLVFSAGIITIVSGGVTLATSGANAFFYNTLFHLKVGFNVSATTGQISTRLNGSAVTALATAANVDTASIPSNLPITAFQNTGSAGSGLTIWLGFPVWHDGTGPAPFNDFLPGMPVAVVDMPVADVGTPGYTPNGLIHNWQNDAAIPASAPNFNSAATVGLIDVASFGPPPANITQVFAVQHFDYSLTVTGTRAQTKSWLYSTTTVAGAQNFLAGGPVTYSDWTAYSIASPTALLANLTASAVITELGLWHSQIEVTA
jgi:hypothetical protein